MNLLVHLVPHFLGFVAGKGIDPMFLLIVHKNITVELSLFLFYIIYLPKRRINFPQPNRGPTWVFLLYLIQSGQIVNGEKRVKETADFYETDLPSLDAELDCWENKWTLWESALNHCSSTLFPNICILL